MFSLLAKNSAAKAPEASLPSAQKRAKIISLLEPVILLVMASLALYALATRSMMPISAACVMLTFALLSPLIALYLILGGKVKLHPSTPSLPTLSAEGGESVQIPPQPRPLESEAVPPEPLEEMEALQTKLRAAEAATANLQASQAALQQKIESAETKRRELVAELTKLRSENATLVSEKEKDIRGLQATAKQERESLHAQITTLRQEAETAKEEHRQNLMTLQTKQDGLQKANTSQTFEIGRLEALQSSVNEKAIQLTRDLEARNAEIADLRKRIGPGWEKAQRERIQIERELKALREQYAVIHAQLKEPKKEIQSLRDQLMQLNKKKDEEITEANRKATTYQEQASSLQKKLDTQSKELSEDKLRVQALTAKNISLEKERDKAWAARREVETRNAQLSRELAGVAQRAAAVVGGAEAPLPRGAEIIDADAPPPAYPADLEAQRKAKSKQLLDEIVRLGKKENFTSIESVSKKIGLPSWDKDFPSKMLQERKSLGNENGLFDDEICIELFCQYILNEGLENLLKSFKAQKMTMDLLITAMDEDNLMSSHYVKDRNHVEEIIEHKKKLAHEAGLVGDYMFNSGNGKPMKRWGVTFQPLRK